jgi:hypothetical protein
MRVRVDETAEQQQPGDVDQVCSGSVDRGDP